MSSNCTDAIPTYSDTDVSLWSCQSLYPKMAGLTPFSPQQVGVYAVSRCPLTWRSRSQELGFSAADSRLVQDTCSGGTSGPLLVSDVATGRVYKNDYCALCSGVPLMTLWPHSAACSRDLLDMVQGLSQLTLDMVDQLCGSCSSFSPPPLYLDRTRSVSEHPRSCTPAVSTCPSFSEFLRLEFNPSVSAEEYELIVTNCTQETSYVQAFSSISREDVVFKNEHCLQCNDFPPSVAPLCFKFASSSYPACKSATTSSSQVELVFDSATSTIQIFDHFDRAQPVHNNLTLDVQCPEGQVFNFATRSCRVVSCFQFDLSISEPACDIMGFSAVGNDTTTTDAVCSEEIVLDNPILLFPLSNITFYYVPLLSIIFVSYFNERGLPVACLDTAIPLEFAFLRVVKALNVLIFIAVAVSGVVCAAIALVYSVPPSMRSTFGVIVANFAAVSLLADISILLGYPGAFLSGSGRLCYAAGFLDHFFGLCQFYWLAVHTFYFVRRCYRQDHSSPPLGTFHVLSLCVAFGWGFPVFFTSLEVGVTFINGDMNQFFSCFQVSSLWTTLFLYIIPGAVVVCASLAVTVLYLLHAVKRPGGFSRVRKWRFVSLLVLLSLMLASVLVRGGSLGSKNRFHDIIVGFFRLLLIFAVSLYLAVAFLFTDKVRKAVCGCGKGSVVPATVDERRTMLGRTSSNFRMTLVRFPSDHLLSEELERFAQHLENPWAYSATGTKKTE